MQPENSIANNQAGMVGSNVSMPTPMTGADKAPETKETKEKMSKKNIIGLVILSLIAVGGVLFGVYGMNSQNEKVAELTARVTNAEGKVAELETEKVTITEPSGEKVEIVDSAVVSSFSNPVIASNNPDEEYGVQFRSETVLDNDGKRVSILVKNGAVSSCYIETPNGNGSWSIAECNITGLTGRIYKVVEFGAGQMNMDDQIGFIMTDGTVQYLPLYEAVRSNDFSIRGTLKTDGYVVDALNITVDPTNSPAGGYASTIFVKSDGSFVKYETSMLN